MRALIITGKYVTDSEYVYALYRMQEEGIETHVATLDGQDTLGILGEKVKATHKVADVHVSDYELLILPGGAKAMEYLRQSEDVMHVIGEFNYFNRIIASICHGAQLLISAQVVKDKDVSGYYSIKDDINNAGGRFVDAPYVRDGNLISSPHYRYLGVWMKAVLKAVYEA